MGWLGLLSGVSGMIGSTLRGEWDGCVYPLRGKWDSCVYSLRGEWDGCLLFQG